MADLRERKRRQQATIRRAIQIIRSTHPELWAAAYAAARAETSTGA